SDHAVSFGRTRSRDGASLRRSARRAARSFRRKADDCGDVSRQGNRPCAALELTQRYQLVSRERAERNLAFTEQYRTYVINYLTGKELVGAYVHHAGQDEAGHWAAYERILSELMLPMDLTASVPHA